MTNDDSEYPDWDLDLPERFTAEWIAEQDLERLEAIETHLDELTDEQQKSYRPAAREFFGPSIEVGRQAFSVEIPISAMSPALQASMERITKRLRDQLNVAERLSDLSITNLDVPEIRIKTTHRPGPTGPTGPSAPSASKPPTQTVSPTGIPSGVEFGTPTVTKSQPRGATAHDLSSNLASTADESTAIRELVALSRDNAERTIDGAFLTGLVAFAVIVAGVAPITAADTWEERLWTIAVSVGLWGIAYSVYLVRKLRRGRASSGS